MIDFESESVSQHMPIARIKVLGVGGGGSNMVNSMIDAGYSSVDFIVTNTDAQALKTSKAPHKIQLGAKSTKGLGAGANPEIGRRAAEEDIDKILDCLDDADVVFLTGGMGGGTGSGALPVIARALKAKDILTIAVVTKPFVFEGKRRMKVAQEALDLLKCEIDTLITLPNQKLIGVVDQKVSLMNAFSMINSVLNQFVRSIADIISKPGHINVDFADIRTIMKQKGYAIIGTGRATGEDRAREAALRAISSPLLDTMQIAGARGVLLNITGNKDLGLHELSAAASVVYEQAHEDASIILGSVIDESLGNEVTVTVIATGFSETEADSVVDSCYDVQTTGSSTVMQSESKPELVTEQSDQIESIMSATQVPETASLDLNNLDIPAIMRRLAQEKQMS